MFLLHSPFFLFFLTRVFYPDISVLFGFSKHGYVIIGRMTLLFTTWYIYVGSLGSPPELSPSYREPDLPGVSGHWFSGAIVLHNFNTGTVALPAEG
jgi:hypothetical protein